MTTVRELLHFGQPQTLPIRQGVSPVMALQDEMNRLFGDFFGDRVPYFFSQTQQGALLPSMDVSETEKEYKITAELPGIDLKDVDITVADGYVTISGEKKEEKKEEKGGYFRQERSYGSFKRTVALPDTANFDKADAQMKNGVLTVSVPKQAAAQAKSRKLEIKNAA